MPKHTLTHEDRVRAGQATAAKRAAIRAAQAAAAGRTITTPPTAPNVGGIQWDFRPEYFTTSTGYNKNNKRYIETNYIIFTKGKGVKKHGATVEGKIRFFGNPSDVRAAIIAKHGGIASGDIEEVVYDSGESDDDNDIDADYPIDYDEDIERYDY